MSSEIIQVLTGHKSDVTSCDFYDNYLATSSADKSIKVWQSADGSFEEVKFSPLLAHSYGVNCVHFSPLGNLLASCSTDGKAIIWTVQDGLKLIEMKHSSCAPIRVCSFSSMNLFATGGDDEKVVLWDITTNSVIRVFEGHEAMITSLAFTPDATYLLSCSTAGDIMLWAARYGHGKCLASVVNAHDLGVMCCSLSPHYEVVAEHGFSSGRYTLATCGNDDLVKIWLLQCGPCNYRISYIRKLEGHSGNVMSCKFSPDGTVLASTGGDRSCILWNVENGQALQKLEGHSRYVTCCAFSNPSLLATGSNDKTVIIRSLDKGKLMDSVAELSAETNKNYIASDQKKQNILSWNIDDVANWLKSLKLDEFIETFHCNSIDGKELMYLTHETLLSSLKIESLGHRNKILRSIQCLKSPVWQYFLHGCDAGENLTLVEFYCPITLEVMKNPVVAADGYSYERSAIEEWFQSGRETSPMTNKVLDSKLLIPNRVLLDMIRKYTM